MRAIPIPIRKRILELYERGRSTREIAQFSGFCIAAVRRVRQQFRERRTLEPRTYLCGRKTLLSEERKQRLHQLLSQQPDATLAELGAGMDRPSTHEIRGVREAFEAAGARLLYLPPYSPDFNPIEPMWSKVKQNLRSHAPRSDKQLLRAAKKAFQSISAADCKGFFFSARYAT